MTRKIGSFVHLNENESRYAVKLITNLRSFNILARRENFPCTILEIHAMCIREYNTYRGHPSPDIFSEQDKKLNLSIELVNQEIRRINHNNVKISPRFNKDIEFTRKNNSKFNKYRFNFSTP